MQNSRAPTTLFSGHQLFAQVSHWGVSIPNLLFVFAYQVEDGCLPGSKDKLSFDKDHVSSCFRRGQSEARACGNFSLASLSDMVARQRWLPVTTPYCDRLFGANMLTSQSCKARPQEAVGLGLCCSHRCRRLQVLVKQVSKP